MVALRIVSSCWNVSRVNKQFVSGTQRERSYTRYYIRHCLHVCLVYKIVLHTIQSGVRLSKPSKVIHIPHSTRCLKNKQQVLCTATIDCYSTVYAAIYLHLGPTTPIPLYRRVPILDLLFPVLCAPPPPLFVCP